MYFELLSLEIHASMAGLKVGKPPVCKGESGVEHRFSFVASDGNMTYGFDIYNDVSQEEVIKTFAKKLDTKVYASVVSLRGRPNAEVAALADDYGITILGPADIETFFKWMKVEQKEKENPIGANELLTP
jgi:hypothetical protein